MKTKQVKIISNNVGKPDRLFMVIPEEQLSGWPETIISIDVKRKDGKAARFHLSLRTPGDTRGGKVGQIYATVRACRNGGSAGSSDVEKQVMGNWINFEVGL